MKARRAVCVISLGLWLPATAAQFVPFSWVNPLPQGNDLNDVTYAKGIFVAVGDFGTVITSSNGIDWQLQKTPTLCCRRSFGIDSDFLRWSELGRPNPVHHQCLYCHHFRQFYFCIGGCGWQHLYVCRRDELERLGNGRGHQRDYHYQYRLR